MSLTFEGRRQILAARQAELLETLWELFPKGAEISWRTENSMTMTGTIVGHEPRGIIRVVDRLGYSNITIADILRATP